jgi:hypothetical protein
MPPRVKRARLNRLSCVVAVFALLGAAPLLTSSRAIATENVQANFLDIPAAGGFYGDASNWSLGVVPNNTPATHYDVYVPGRVVLVNTDASIDSLTAPSANFHVDDHTFVSGHTQLDQLTVTAQSADATASLGALSRFDAATGTLGALEPFEYVTYTVIANGGRSAVMRFSGADIVTNAVYLDLRGAGAKVTDENGNDALRNISRNVRSLTLSARSFVTKGDFTNDGALNLGDASDTTDTSFTVNGNLLNFDTATHTLKSGSYDLLLSGTPGGGASTAAQTFRFNDADIVTNAASILLGSAQSRIVDQFDNDALRHFAHNTGTFALNGGSLTTAADFTNDGELDLGGTFTVSGTLTNFANHALNGGTYTVAAGGALRFRDADVVTNAATVFLRDGGAIMDQNGQNAFRNLARNAPNSVFSLSATSLAIPAGFVNEGSLSVTNPSPPILHPPVTFSMSADFSNTGSVLIGNVTNGFPTLSQGPAEVQVSKPGSTATNTGDLSIGQGGSLTLSSTGVYLQTEGTTLLDQGTMTAGSIRIRGGVLTGHGTIVGDVIVDSTGAIVPTGPRVFFLNGPTRDGTLTVNGSVTVGSTGHAAFAIGGVVPGSDIGGYDNVIASGPVTLSGSLDVSFDTITSFDSGAGGIILNGDGSISVIGGGPVTKQEYIPSSTDTFVLLTGSSITGQFDNAPDGSRLITRDGLGSFIVHYASAESALGAPATITEVVLTDFQSLPEPTTCTLGLIASAAALLRRRRAASPVDRSGGGSVDRPPSAGRS